MDKIIQVIRREYLQQVRTKSFIIFTLLTPLLLAGMMALPSLFLLRESDEQIKVVVVDGTGELFAALEAEMMEPLAAPEEASERPPARPQPELVEVSEAEAPPPAPPPARGWLPPEARKYLLEEISGPWDEARREQLKEDLLAEQWFAAVLIPPDVAQGGRPEYLAKNLGNIAVRRRVGSALTRIVVHARLTEEGLDPGRIGALTRRVRLEERRVTEKGEEKSSFGVVYMTTLTFVMLLYMTMFGYGIQIMNSIIEEKTSRVVEVLLASVKPFQLMMGKILGVGLVGLTQFAVWLVLGALVWRSGRWFLHWLKVPDLKIPVDLTLYLWFVVFFLLGYFTYAALYAVVGSMCTSQQDAQQAQFPVTMALVACLMLSFLAINDPGLPVVQGLSFTPLLSPILMFVRISVQTPPLWQILLAVVVNVGFVIGFTWLTARIYRIGILMYGKRATIPELIRWARQP